VIYYTQNNIGSTSLLTDKDGVKVAQYLYKPYGEEWVKDESGSASEIIRRFTGQIFDKETGLYYYNARYYDPAIGNFITPDPALSGLNHYAYCSANPIKYRDPTGLYEGEENDESSGAAAIADSESWANSFNPSYDYSGIIGGTDPDLGYSKGDGSALDNAYGGNGTDLTWGGRDDLDYGHRDQYYALPCVHILK
jgi:RHS repeat-associated protein